MKKIFFLLFLPVLLFEVFLHLDNDFYKKILMYNYDFSEWKEAAPKMNYWKDTIIMGSSVAKQSIDPAIIEQQFKTNDVQLTVGTIAVNADSTLHDYLTLKRILATCDKCPTRIIYQVTDMSLKNSEIKVMKENSLRRMLKLYIPDNDFESILKESSNLDPYFKEYYNDLQIYKMVRIPFTKGRIIGFMVNNLLKSVGLIKDDIYEPNYADPGLINDGNGFYSYSNILDENAKKSSLKFKTDALNNYEIGGATELFFIKFIELAKERNIKLYLVLTPEYKLHQSVFSIQEKKLTNFIRNVSLKYNLPFIDDRSFNDLNVNYFYDLTHLNVSGAPVFSKYLAKQLFNYY